MIARRLNRLLERPGNVPLLTLAGTLICVMAAVSIDAVIDDRNLFELRHDMWSNVMIPLLIAPPFFYFLLSKLRELGIAHRQLEIVASTDSLTSCLNRAAFATLVESYLEKFADNEARLEGAMLVIDVDHFKHINDTFGHDAGDDALRSISSAIRSATRDVDLVGRLGGEEFAVFIPGSTETQARAIAERIMTSVREAFFSPHGTPIPISVSIGLSRFGGSTSFSQLYREADQHLYAAKRQGRNRIVASIGEPLRSH